MKKVLLAILLPLALFASDLEERIKMLEEQMSSIGTDNPNQTFGANFAPSHFDRGWVSLTLNGSFLYWHPKIGGTEYAYNLLRDAIGFNVPQSGEVKEQTFDWDVGARAGAALYFPVLGYEFALSGTWYSTSQSLINSRSLPSILVNLRGAFLTQPNQARSTSSLSYDSILVELRKPQFLSSFLSFCSSIGVKKDQVDQKQTLRYRLSSQQFYHVKDKCAFDGVGPRLAYELKWHFLYGISLFGHLGGALLYGAFDVKHDETLNPLSAINLKANTHLFSPQVDFSLALGWDLYARTYHLGFSIGYEALYMWRQNEALQMEDSVPAGVSDTQGRFQFTRYAEDITLYGLTLKATLSF